MNYVKKMCILRQIKQGFSGDGKALSGLIKAEQYGKNLAVEVSIINFAPLVSGEYYCLLSDGKGKTEMLCLRGKSLFNILTDMDISGGFCGIICYVKTEVVPIAYGIHGNGAYDWRTILNKAMPPVFPKKQEEHTAYADSHALYTEENEPTMYEMNAKIPLQREREALAEEKRKPPAQAREKGAPPTEDEQEPLVQERQKGVSPVYDDEVIAGRNYYEEGDYESIEPTKIDENARAQGGAEAADTQAGENAAEDDDAAGVLHPFKREGDGYYRSVKRELDELFAKYPADDTLTGAFQRSEWVRLRGEEGAPEFLVGALYEEGQVKYICYALAAEDKENPPKEIKGVCSFVPLSPYVEAEGFFVIFQSAATGECIKPSRA